MVSAVPGVMPAVSGWSGWQVLSGQNAVPPLPPESMSWIPEGVPNGAPSTTAGPPSSSHQPQAYAKRQPDAEHPCHVCQDTTHWARNCPHRKRYGGREPRVNQQSTSNLNAMTASNRAADVYLRFVIGKKRGSCLLDTGCETSVIGRRLVPDLVLQPTSQRLYAANGTDIPLLGEATISFRLQDVPATAKVAVAESLGDLILRIDWMIANNCRWDFGRGLTMVQDQVLRLHNRPRQGLVRRIFVEQDIVIPAGHQRDISVNVTWPNLHPAGSDLVVSPKPFQPGVVTARSLMDISALQSAVRVMNFTEEDFVISKGTYIGPAEELEVCCEQGEVPDPAKVS